MYTVRGRGLKAPRVEHQWVEDGVLLRIDDTENCEFWCHVQIPEEQLVALLNAYRDQIGKPRLVEESWDQFVTRQESEMSDEHPTPPEQEKTTR